MDILTPYTGKNIVTDATLLTSTMKCGTFADLSVNQSFQSINGKSNSLETGSIMHKYLEVYYKSLSIGLGKAQAHGQGLAAAELYIQGCPHCTNYVGEGRPECGHEPNDYPGTRNTPAESEGYAVGWKYVLQTCEEYYEFYKSDFWVTVDTEVVKSKVLYQDDEVRILFKSKLDWIVDTNEGIYPCDHKTMKQNRDTVSLNNQFMGQCLIMDTRNVFINKVGFQKNLKPVDKFKRVSVSYSTARLYEWQSTILPYWCKLMLMYDEMGYWPPNFTSCDSKFGFCQYKEVCEANPDMRNETLQMNFIKGPKWNPTNPSDSSD